VTKSFNPLNTELNPIWHLLALLGAHHILHVSGVGLNNILCFNKVERFIDQLKNVLQNLTENVRANETAKDN
jgi:hypothetical protein